MDIDAKSVAIGGGAVFLATQLFGGSSKKSTSKSLNGPAKRRKASGTKKAGTTKRKTTKRK